MLRRLHPDQPKSFAFTPANQAWAEAQITKYPEGRQASAIIPLLWRAQEQEGWLTRPAIEHVAEMLGLAHIRALEVATFYFMFQLQPVGSVAHVQVCGTTSCMICGAEDLIAVCKDKIAPRAHALSADGKFSWEEVECLGACANAPMAQIGKDYYEDLTAERFAEILDAFAAGEVPVPGPQNARYASEPLSGLTSLEGYESGHTKYNASVQRAVDLGDTIKRIDGTEVPLVAPWQGSGAAGASEAEAPTTEASASESAQTETPAKAAPGETAAPVAKSTSKTAATVDEPAAAAPPVDDASDTQAGADPATVPDSAAPAAEPAAAPPDDTAAPVTAPAPAASPKSEGPGTRPAGLDAAREGGADDLKMIKGVGPKLEKLLNSHGFFHFDQIAGWTADEIAWVDQNLIGFKGRVTRDDWVSQAKLLASGVETEFSKRAKY